MSQPTHRNRYPASDARPAHGWSPPKQVGDLFDCAALHCKLACSVCLIRQGMMIRGTPEPRWPLCHPSCVQGKMVRKAFPLYRAPDAWERKRGRRIKRPPGLAPLREIVDPDPVPEFDLARTVSPRVSPYGNDTCLSVRVGTGLA